MESPFDERQVACAPRKAHKARRSAGTCPLHVNRVVGELLAPRDRPCSGKRIIPNAAYVSLTCAERMPNGMKPRSWASACGTKRTSRRCRSGSGS